MSLANIPRQLNVMLYSLISIAALSIHTHSRGTRDNAAIKAMKDFAQGEYGIVAWMSRGNGTCIWACNLDGSNFHQVTNANGKVHMAPIISPDGKRLIYYERTSGGSYYSDHTGNMMLVDVAAVKGTGKKLASGVRTYFELRWARWIDNDRIGYIANNHDGYEVTVSSGKTRKLYKAPGGYGAVPNPSLTYAVVGKGNIFYKINNPGQNGTLSEKKAFDGCQGNLSADGKWGYRVGKLASGFHPVKKFKLSDFKDGTLLQGKDPAFAAPQNYLYFPQISFCQKFIAVGASRGKKFDEHDHEKADYDIFLVRIDPANLAPKGKAVKYSFASGCDSYPDVWAGKQATGIRLRQSSENVHSNFRISVINGNVFKNSSKGTKDSRAMIIDPLGRAYDPAQSTGSDAHLSMPVSMSGNGLYFLRSNKKVSRGICIVK